MNIGCNAADNFISPYIFQSCNEPLINVGPLCQFFKIRSTKYIPGSPLTVHKVNVTLM